MLIAQDNGLVTLVVYNIIFRVLFVSFSYSGTYCSRILEPINTTFYSVTSSFCLFIMKPIYQPSTVASGIQMVKMCLVGEWSGFRTIRPIT